nr:T9SS type B sorting domain-containing protein [uncultured Allomuricauda sp.]
MLKIRYLFFLVLLCLFAHTSHAQLGFCGGNSGDPIFTETFGTGILDGPPLPPGTTTYNYVEGGPLEPNDGNYTISSRTNYFDWFDTTDHTPGDVNGKSFIVNASFTADTFFNRSITGLCENTSYEFSAWLLNLLPRVSQCPGTPIPINVKFEILDSTGTQVLASGSTGEINSTNTPVWNQFGLVFTTQVGQTSVILRMSNNGNGGCGNDLAIDDIVFRTCGDTISVANSTNDTFIDICEDEIPVSTTLVATPDFSVFQSHVYQWQVSSDGENWTDIPGENNSTYTTPSLNTTTFYRVQVAEDPINLANSSCNIVSDTFEVSVIPRPDAPVSLGDVTVCGATFDSVSVSVPEGVLVNWYDSPVGGTLLTSNTTDYETSVDGTFYAEALTSRAGCISNERTAVSIAFFDLPVLTDEQFSFCEGESIMLSASFPNATYLWDAGQTTEEINVSSPGVYQVTVTDVNGCSNTKKIDLIQIDRPIIEKVNSDHRDIVVTVANEGGFEYSLNGFVYQQQPVFENLLGGNYTIFVRSEDVCDPVAFQFIHIVIPRFFTPNGDGINDSFSPEGVQPFDTFSIRIFDRTSKLLFQSSSFDFSWNGTFNGRPLPESDYWYRIQVGENQFTGHFTLKR